MAATALGERLGVISESGGSPRSITELDMARLRSVPWGDVSMGGGQSVSLSPNNQQLAFLVQEEDPLANTVSLSWYVAPVASPGPAIKVGVVGDVTLKTEDDGTTSGEHIALSTSLWTSDGQWIFFLTNHDGQVQIARSRTNGEKQEALTHSEANVVDFVLDEAEERLLFRAKAVTRAEHVQLRRDEALRGFRVDDRLHPRESLRPMEAVDNRTSLFAYELASHQQRLATNPEQDEWSARVEGDQDRLERLSNQAESGTEVAPPGPFQQQLKFRGDVAAPIFLSQQPGLLALARILNPVDRLAFPTTVLTIVDPAKPGASIPCRIDVCRGIFVRMWSSEDGEVLYFQRQSVNLENEGFYAWNWRAGSVRAILKTNDLISRCAYSQARLICLSQRATAPLAIVSVDLTTGSVKTLVDLNPELRNIAYTQVARLEWANASGQKTWGYVIKPAGYKRGVRYPLVILTYRAVGFFDDSTGREYAAHVLAAKGFLVLVFNRSFERVWTFGTRGQYDNAFQDRREVHDSLEAGIRLLEKQGMVDSSRIAITGLSDGTAITYWELMHSERAYAAAIVSSGSAEPIDYYLTSASWRASMRNDMGVEFSKDGVGKSFFSAFSPSLNVEKILAPLLLNIPDVEALPTMQTLVTFKEYCKPFEAYIYPGEFHEKWQPAHRYFIYRRNVQWLQFWLQNREVSDPVDATQYERWRKLRMLHVRDKDSRLSLTNAVQPNSPCQ